VSATSATSTFPADLEPLVEAVRNGAISAIAKAPIS
jgi:hypothetical protein